MNLEIDSEDLCVWPDASHIVIATLSVLNHHLSYGLKIHVCIFKKISDRNKCTCMGVYGLDLVMDPVQLTFLYLKLWYRTLELSQMSTLTP